MKKRAIKILRESGKILRQPFPVKAGACYAGALFTRSRRGK